MSEFNNVTVVKKANIYFGGNVSSRTIRFADGSSNEHLHCIWTLPPGDADYSIRRNWQIVDVFYNAAIESLPLIKTDVRT